MRVREVTKMSGVETVNAKREVVVGNRVHIVAETCVERGGKWELIFKEMTGCVTAISALFGSRVSITIDKRQSFCYDRIESLEIISN